MKVNLCYSVFLLVLVSCNGKSDSPGAEAINAMRLKRGEIIACGPPDKQFGSVGFKVSCSEVQKEFDLGIALLHSFEYDEAEKVFAKIIDELPGCAMPYWGVAMSNYHPLWAPPAQAELEKGAKAITVAQSLGSKSKKETDYIEAIALFYKDWETTDHRTRSDRFEKAMKRIYEDYPNDKEAAIFYALALTATADPSDKSFVNQKKAGTILNALYADEPDHPGVVHYIIHAYDSPELAAFALPAARKYASVAPSSAHALHMPSHIFTRLGLWDECISSNIACVSSAQCYAEAAGIKGHWDEELHGLDYLIYGYLQKGANDSAKRQLDYLKTINEVDPVNFKVAYAFASIPSRYVLENKLWKEAAGLECHKADFPWKDYPWQRSIIHFARLLGNVHTGHLDSARAELKQLNAMHDILAEQKDTYKANQVEIQLKSSEAWILFKEGKNEEALKLMQLAADLEDKTEKHPVTPGAVIPARELLGDMLLAMNKPDEALQAYEADLKKQPNRFNGLYGAGMAAERSGNAEKATQYYTLLTGIVGANGSDRSEWPEVRKYLNGKTKVR
jgi:tetratricopeptide (TPR) repeat protein